MDTTDNVTAEVATIAAQAARALAPLQREGKKAGTVSIRSTELPEAAAILIPVGALNLLVEILSQMANGRAVTIVPQHAELTTHQAAKLLNVSRPYLISLLNAGKLRFRRVGAHRRIRMADLVEYQKLEELESERVLEELAAEAQKLNLGY